MIGYIVLAAFFVGFSLYMYKLFRKEKWQQPTEAFPAVWRKILAEKISFYNALNAEEKKRFEYKVQEFLLNCQITGIKTQIDDTDRVMVAASAIIPIFAFPEWQYHNLFEVLIYPAMFNQDYEVGEDDSHILGMVGTGVMDGKMIISRKALHLGFANETDKKNTAIHEFVHLIDKSDGVVDGIPMALMNRQYAIPWIDLIKKKIDEIYENMSDINPYGATNKQEFFAVASEYFFEHPKLLAKKHPQLYEMLEKIFAQDMKNMDLRKIKKAQKTGRNDPCPCGSGTKFKKCCGRG